jgi:hypothetical protein
MYNIKTSAAGSALRNFIRTLQGNAYSYPGPFDGSQPVTDPLQKTKYSTFATWYNYPKLVEGVITDFTNVAYAYRVQPWGGTVAITCYAAADSTFGFFGARKLNTYAPGTRVLITIDQQQRFGWIVAVLPSFDTPLMPVGVQQLLGTSRKRVDYSHFRPLLAASDAPRGVKIEIPSNNAGRLLDATSAGEVGYITETGMRFFLDSFMAMFGCDETCALSFFHADQLTRLAAYNYQFWTAGCEQEALNDQGEYNDWIGFTPYPWEQLGLINRPTEGGDYSPALKELDDPVWFGITSNQTAETQGEPWNFKREPQDTHQMPWHRYREFRGYLGQGHKRILQGPPQDTEALTTAFCRANTRVPTVTHPLFFSESVLLDGTWLVESAKQISIIKRVGGISPVRTHRPEQTTASGNEAGDDSSNYKFAGAVGSGPRHIIRSTYAPATDNEIAIQQQVAAIFDLHGYLHNYAGIHPFFWHHNDWYVPEMSEMEYLNNKSVDYANLNFASLASKQNFQKPGSVELKVDHRYNTQRYYQTEAGITFTEDGSVVLFDGYGSAITMSQGNVYIDAAADVFMRAGRNVNAWAGNDVNVRAKDSIDLVASSKDVRIKAENNLQLLGGNSGNGGILLESRGRGNEYSFDTPGENTRMAGILLRSGRSDIVSWSSNIYLRTGGAENTTREDPQYIAPGNIVLDSGRGNTDIVMHSRFVSEFLSQSHNMYFGENGVYSSASNFSDNNTILAGFLLVSDAVYVDGQILANGSILAGEGVVAAANGCLPTPMDENSKRQVKDACESIKDSIRSATVAGTTFYNSFLDTRFYQPNQAGSDETINAAQFSLRTTDDYGLSDFKLFETRWQQLAREAEYTLPAWEEKPVTTKFGDSYPFPGRFTEQNFYQQKLQLFDAGNYKDREVDGGQLAAAYANGTLATPELKTLNDYTVTGSGY